MSIYFFLLKKMKTSKKIWILFFGIFAFVGMPTFATSQKVVIDPVTKKDTYSIWKSDFF